MKTSPRLLAICPRFPWPPRDGPTSKTAHIFERTKFGIDLLSPDKGPLPSKVTHIQINAAPPSPLRSFASLTRGQLLSNARWPSAPVLAIVDSLLAAGGRYDLIHLDTLAVAHLARPLRNHFAAVGQHPTIVASINDSYSLLKADTQPTQWRRAGFYLISRRAERTLLRAPDLVDVVGINDYHHLRRRRWATHVRLVPLGYEEHPHPRSLERPREERRWDLGLFADRKGTHTFIRAGLPALLRRRPSTTFYLGGAAVTPDDREHVTKLGGHLMGYVPSIQDLLLDTRVVLAPSPQRSGLSTRALDAAAAGAVVVGGRCVETIPGMTPDQSYLSANTVDAQVHAVLRALIDPLLAIQIGDTAFKVVSARPSWDAIVKLYEAGASHLATDPA